MNPRFCHERFSHLFEMPKRMRALLPAGFQNVTRCFSNPTQIRSRVHAYVQKQALTCRALLHAVTVFRLHAPECRTMRSIAGAAQTKTAANRFAAVLYCLWCLQRYALFKSAARIGNLRTRLPVAMNTAFATLGPQVATIGSPIPPGFSVEATMCTSTRGISFMRSTG
jgi:hypothetical protein